MITSFNPSAARVIRNVGLSLRDFVAHIVDEDEDFELSILGGSKSFRFIREDCIDQIMQEELASDTYTLGCFNVSVLSEATGLPQIVFDALQEHDAYDAAGEIILALNKIEELQQLYVRYDGYGHHFAQYDGNEEELYIQDGLMFYMFRVN